MAAAFFQGISGSIRRSSPAPTETIGTSGTVILAGFIQSREKNPALRDDRRYETYSDILANIDIVGASVRYYLNLATAASWTVEPADADDPQAVEVADFVEDVLGDMLTPWRRVVRRALMYRYYGFSVQEWTAKSRADGKIGFEDIAARPQSTIERWDTDDPGNVLGVTQRVDNKLGRANAEVYLPRTKIVYVVDDSLNDSPEGFGLFRHMVETSQRLKRFQDLEAFGFETDLRGIPKGRAPYGVLDSLKKDGLIDDAEAAKILAPLEDFIKKHIKSPELGIMLDSSVYRDEGETRSPSSVPLWDLELLTGGNTSAVAVAAAIERLQREMARIAGTEGLLLGGDKVGSLALSKDKTANFALIVDSALKELTESFQKDVVETLMALNGIDEDLWPKLVPEQIQYRDIEQITGALESLSNAGAPLAPDDPAIDVIRGLLGLPPQPMDDAILDANLRGTGDDPPTPPTPPDDQVDPDNPDDMPAQPGSEEAE